MIRNPIFDMMKGIAIIAVVVGHCPVGSIVTNFIFTWHIPLFFVIVKLYLRHFRKYDEDKVV